MKNLLIKIYLLVVMCLLISVQISANSYYVSTTGNNSNSGTSISSAWRTIQHAATQVNAGDVVYIQSGTYSEDVSLEKSGNASDGYISFIGQGNVVMDGQNSINIAFRNLEASYIHIENITIRDYIEEGIRFAPFDGPRIHHFRFKNLSILNIGISGSSNHGLQIQETDYFLVDGVSALNCRGNNIFVNRCQYGAVINSEASDDGQRYNDDEDGIGIQNSQYIRIANCTANGNPEDGIDIGGEGANGDIAHIRVYGCTTMYNQKKGLSLSVADNGEFAGYDITFARCLSAENNVSGMDCYQEADDFRVVHNTYANNGQYGLNIRLPLNNGIVKNCIFAHQGTNLGYNSGMDSPSVIEFDYMNWYPVEYPFSPYDDYFRGNNRVEADPLLADINNGDYTLNDNSPCIDEAGDLTTTTSGGNGTQISVGDAKYFSDGYYAAPGDIIDVGNETVQIVDIQGNTITVDRSISWNTGTPVNFAFEGNGPDLGYSESGGSAPPPPPPTECDLIDNGDFSDNLNDWGDWGCEMSLQNGEAFVDISGNSAGIKKGNGSLTFEQGKTYRITFDARAQSNRNMRVKATLDYAPYDLYFQEEVVLTTSMQSYELAFTMGQSSPASSLEFNFGGSTSNVYLDNVQVSEVDCGETPPPPPPTECDLIDNGDFSDNLNNWGDWGCEMSLQNGEAFVDISSNSAGIKKGNGTLTFQQGKIYRITFDARAQSNRNMRVKATLDYSPYTLYFQEEVALTTSMQSYELTFTMGQSSPASALEFNFGGNTSNVYLDNVQVSEVDCGTNPPTSPEGDLSIRYIQRLPEIEYVQNSTNPTVEGWPLVGQQVTWRAKVKHWGTSTATFDYRWYLDGSVVASGTTSVNEGEEVNIDYTQNWSFDRKELKLVIDTGNDFAEDEEDNNEVSIFTDALSTGFYIEQGLYDYFHQYQNQLNVGSNSFEDWAHRQVEIWNNMLADAVTADTPNAVLDRIRLDKITVVPDGDLPLAGGWPSYPTNKPAEDKTIDLIWGFPTEHYLGLGTFSDKTEATLSNPFYFDRGLFHELGHARYLIDVYGFNIEYETEGEVGQTIDIQENGVDIDDAGLFPMPYRTDMPGLMNQSGEYTQIDAYSAVALNLIAGRRAVCGNYNSPCNIGSRPNGFMQDLPTQNRILINDIDGQPLTDADVQIYQSTEGSTEWYGKRFDNTPDLTLTTDQNGYIYVGNNPFTNGDIKHTGGYSNAVVIIRIEKDNNVAYKVFESWRLNMEYWRGNTQLGTYTLESGLEGGTTPPPPPAECDLIGNGDFSDNLNNWGDWGCEMSLQNGEAFVDISSNSAGIKKGNSTLTFEQGKTYRITFDARAQSGRNMKVKATLDYAPYDLYFQEEVALTTSMQSFEMTFTMGQYSAASALEFSFRGNTSNVYLDNVQVSEVDCGETPPPPPVECDLIDNGDFSDNLNNWSDWGCEIELQNGEALVDISSNSAGIKKGNGTLTFQQGKTYRITFDARVQSGRNMKVKATLDYAPYDSYFQEEVALTTSMQSYELTFTMGQSSPASALEFDFRGNTTNVYLDNVQVTELDCDARQDAHEANSFQATAFPNPFTGQTQLEYELFHNANVQINVYNAMGQLVNTPVPVQAQFAGVHQIYFGENIPSGVYLCELKVDDVRKVIKIVKSK